ncbi:porin [Burkholderia multivorans]|uniref:porin n=1 Tax=Burkholderia multivorans TaxID=87883 RepID=UPI001C24DF1F|nr:porin [Burkholderia multivorans]MBU9205425.1 porin [Burkholderia multivorans]MCO8353434.1 porin [Burkholderia multivorans]MCO8385693.1 porin [Burkholderia multivorans]MCO8406626.1 porin [Burkholderia multivorans]MCO8434789.1 porin [Burkholderia multivorans]
MIEKKICAVLVGVTVFAAASSAAFGQSSLTIYGRIDAGIEYANGIPTGASSSAQTTGGASRWSGESGDGGVSMFGIKGTEDLGGGTTVQFHLENQFTANNGQLAGAGFFNRFSTVGVANDRLGALTVGHQLFISNAVWDFDPFGQSPWASASLDRGRNWPFSDNAIQYDSPKLGGFAFSGQYSLSNATSWNGNGTTPDGRMGGAYVTYTNSLVQLRAMYDETRDPSNGQFDNVYLYSREYTLAANVFLGSLKLQAAWQASRTSGVTANTGDGPTTTDYEWAGATWQASRTLSWQAAVYHINANNDGGNATMYSIGAIYDLSARTQFHTQIVTVRNSRTANFSMSAISGLGTTVASGNPLTGHSQSGAFIGIMHYF